MNQRKLEHIVNTFVLTILALVNFLLATRLLLKLTITKTSGNFTTQFYSSTHNLLKLFEGTFSSIEIDGFVLELDTFVAILIYLFAGISLYKLIQSIFEEDITTKIKIITNVILNILKTLLVLRIIFKILDVGQSIFVEDLYEFTNYAIQPIAELFPSLYEIKYGVELSTFIVVITIFLTHSLIQKLINLNNSEKELIFEDKSDTELISIKEYAEIEEEVTFFELIKQGLQNISELFDIFLSDIETFISPILSKKNIRRKEIQEILENNYGQISIIEINSILSPFFYRDPSSLTRSERNVVLALEYLRETLSGGLQQFFINYSGSYSFETLIALKEIGLFQHHQILEKAISFFQGHEVSKISEIRNRQIDNLDEGCKNAWDKLSLDVYQDEKIVYTRVLNYIKENIQDFR